MDTNTRRTLVLNMRGSATGTPTPIPRIEATGTEEAVGFDLPVFDLASGDQVGTVLETLADITPMNGGLALVGTQTFRLGDGELTVRGLTSVAPMTHGSPGYTHMTSGMPADGENDVLSGTGAYDGAAGPVRLSGAVNLSRFDSEGRIDFNCIFVVNLAPVALPDQMAYSEAAR
ncbi:MAG: hypothetical protein RIE08_02050 [Acidimicrobiales bacterium]